jgi:hypothetical protein
MAFGAHLVDIVAYGPEGVTFDMRFEAPFEMHGPGGAKQTLDPEDWQQLAALFVVRYDTIRVAQVTKTADLRVEFASGHVLACSAQGPYESWELHAPDGVMLIGVSPEPAIFDGKHREHYRRVGGPAVEGPERPRPAPESRN